MTPETAERKSMGEFGRLANVFLDPRPAFADIAARPRPWAPLVLLIALSVAYMAAFSQRVGWSRFMTQRAERTPAFQSMSADQRAKALETQSKIGGLFDKLAPASPVFTVPLFTLLLAAVLALVFRTLLSVDVTFRQFFAITAYAWLPDLLMLASCIAVVFLKPPDEFNFENPVAFNAGAFLEPESTSAAMMSLAASLDVFSFWKMALLAVGISAAARKFSFARALTGIAALWLLWVAVKTGLAAIMR